MGAPWAEARGLGSDVTAEQGSAAVSGGRRRLDDLYADPGFAPNHPGSPRGSPPLPGPAVLVCEVRAVDYAASEVPWSTHTMVCLPTPSWLQRGQELKTANHTG